MEGIHKRSLRARSPSFASDVFSFGMCILEAVSQEVPWGYHVDDDTVRYLVLSGELPEQPASMPDRVWDLVKRMCRLDPKDRPRLASVVAELDELIQDDALAKTVSSVSSVSGKVAADMAVACEAAVATPTPVCSSGVTQEQRAKFASPFADASTPQSLEVAIAHDDVTRVAHWLSTSVALLESPVDGWDAAPLIVAAATGAGRVTQLLLERGANTHAVTSATSNPTLRDLDDTSCTALHVAAHAGHAHIVTALVAANRDVTSVRTAKQRSAVYFAAQAGHSAVVEVLVRLGVNSDAVCESETGKTALMVAADHGQPKCVHTLLLLDRTTDIHAKDTDGSTALHYAAANGHIDAIHELLRHGARIEESGYFGHTPLIEAAMNNQLECLRVLLKHKPNVHAKSKNGATALQEAVTKGHVELINVLLRHGARIEDADRNGDTSLHVAVAHVQLESLRALLAHKPNVNVKRADGVTALSQAVAKQHVAFVEALVAAGATVTRDDYRVARWNKHLELMMVLEPHAPSALGSLFR